MAEGGYIFFEPVYQKYTQYTLQRFSLLVQSNTVHLSQLFLHNSQKFLEVAEKSIGITRDALMQST